MGLFVLAYTFVSVGHQNKLLDLLHAFALGVIPLSYYICCVLVTQLLCAVSQMVRLMILEA